jgi:hypothetical protein
MPPFWRNPEFVRHRRAELRPVRAITVALVVIVMCALLGMACWSFEQTQRAAAPKAWDRDTARQTWLLFYRWLVGLQGMALTFWTLFMCAQSVSGERDRKTWDFQRTTRLTPAEILIGKLLGEPVLMYFAVLCAAPVTLIAGLAGGLSVVTVVSVFAFLAITSLFLGLAGMWLSTLLESRTRGVGLIGALGLYAFTLGIYGMRESGLPALAAMSPLVGIVDLLGGIPDSSVDRPPAVLFGHAMPWLLMNLLLCGSFGAWLVVMLIRNLKRDYQEIRPLSRWQAISCAAFLNFLIYALLSPGKLMDSLSGMARQGMFPNSRSVAVFAVAMNGLILFLIGLATLTPQERLRVWSRKHIAGQSSMFADDGLPWPWLGISAAVAYALMVWGLLAWDHTLPLDGHTLQTAAIQMLLVLVFVMRDVLFLQWCVLTRLRQPIVKGILFLCLYYAAAGVLTGMAGVSSNDAARWMMSLLTPVQAFDGDVRGLAFPTSTYLGLALQTGVIGVVLVAISSRLQRPMQVGAAT